MLCLQVRFPLLKPGDDLTPLIVTQQAVAGRNSSRLSKAQVLSNDTFFIGNGGPDPLQVHWHTAAIAGELDFLGRHSASTECTWTGNNLPVV